MADERTNRWRRFKVRFRMKFGKWRLVWDDDHHGHYERRRFHV